MSRAQQIKDLIAINQKRIDNLGCGVGDRVEILLLEIEKHEVEIEKHEVELWEIYAKSWGNEGSDLDEVKRVVHERYVNESGDPDQFESSWDIPPF